MNRVLQLYIGSERIDLFKDESISITQSIQNVRDIEKIFTSFSKTFSIPASKKNNKIFKHFYNYDIVNGFDARLKVNSRLEINNMPFKIGKLKLEGVDLKNRKANVYRVTFFGSTVELKDLLGDDKLNNLSFTAHNLLYGAETVRGRLTNNPETRDVVCPLITHTQRLFYDSDHSTDVEGSGNLHYHSGGGQHVKGVRWNELKYAIRLNTIIEEIEDRYRQPNYPVNLSFSNDFFKNNTKKQMHNLFMWLHRKSGDVENLAGTSEIETLVDNFPSFLDNDYNVVMDTDILYVGQEPQYVNTFRLSITPAVAFEEQEYSVRISNEFNDEFYVSGTITGNFNVRLNEIVDNESDLFNRAYRVFITTTGGMTFSRLRWILDFETYGDPPFYETFEAAPFSTATVFQFNINQQIPDIKVIEFLTGLFKMFNLTAFIDEDVSDETNSVIKVIPLDEYYSLGKGALLGTDPWDISKYVDSTKSTVNSTLPYRRLVFQYKDTKTFLANRFSQLANRDWGEIDYTTGEAELAGGLYKIEVPFSHFQFERLQDADVSGSAGLTNIQWGYSVNESQNAYKGDPLLFYPVLSNSTGAVSFVNDINPDGTVNSHIPIYNPVIPSNSVVVENGVPSNKDNCNFGNEINEFSRNTEYSGTLFNNFYRTYVTDLFDTKKRLTKVTAYLPLNILTNIRLNDQVVINQRKYTINTMTTNLLTGKTDFELLNII